MTEADRARIPEVLQQCYRLALGLEPGQDIPIEVVKKHADVQFALARLKISGTSITQRDAVIIAALCGKLPAAPAPQDPANPTKSRPLGEVAKPEPVGKA